MRLLLLFLFVFGLTGCNSIYLKPGTLDKSQMVYAPRAGFSMARSIKQIMEERGYDVSTGKLIRVSEISGKETYQIPKNAKYAINVDERNELLRPIWCIFNGFWWWNFNVSIINRANNDEILSWRGRGCQNSSLRKLNAVLDKLEMNNVPISEPKATVKKSTKKRLHPVLIIRKSLLFRFIEQLMYLIVNID